MLAIQPAGHDGGDEELRAVAVGGDGLAIVMASGKMLCRGWSVACLRVWAGVGHGQKSGLGVLSDEVLVGELLAVDGLATGALVCMLASCSLWVEGLGWGGGGSAYVATGEVTTLEHELRDDAVEGRAGVAEALLAGAESAEVLSGLGDNVVVEVEVDAAGLLCWGGVLC